VSGDPGEGLVIGRRHVLGLVAGAAALAACGGNSASKGQAPGGSSGGASTGGGSAAASVSTGSFEGPVVPDANRVPVERVTSWADRFAKTWKGAWKDDSGGSGTADGSISLDAMAFAGRGQLSLSDGFLGAGAAIAPAVYDIDLAKFDYSADTHRISSPQLGEIEITVEGFGAVKLICTKVPGHPDIDTLEIDAQGQQGTGVASVTYKVNRGGQVTRGAMALSSGSDRPPAPEPGSANQQTEFIMGDYAASLVTAAQLSQAVGVTVHAPVANGGKLNYAPGIDVSNARAETDDPNVIIQYSVYRGTDAATARAFLELNSSVATPVTGLGDGAYLVKAPVFLQVLQGKEVAEVTVLAPSGSDVAALDRAVAEAMLPKLGR
jgi:hypothetical protein